MLFARSPGHLLTYTAAAHFCVIYVQWLGHSFGTCGNVFEYLTRSSKQDSTSWTLKYMSLNHFEEGVAKSNTTLTSLISSIISPAKWVMVLYRERAGKDSLTNLAYPNFFVYEKSPISNFFKNPQALVPQRFPGFGTSNFFQVYRNRSALLYSHRVRETIPPKN